MGKISMKGVCDMHVHTNPDLRLRAYDDFQLADAAIRVGARAIVIKTHLGFTVNRAYLTNQYVKRVYGENTGFTMYGGVVMNKVIGGINPEAVEKGFKEATKSWGRTLPDISQDTYSAVMDKFDKYFASKNTDSTNA